MRVSLKKTFSLLIALSMVFGLFASDLALTAQAAGFNDTAKHWAKGQIDRWAGYGVLNGVTSSQFRPDNNITRAEFFAIMGRLFAPTQTADISKFQDVPRAAWFYNDIAKAVKMDIANGLSDSSMGPKATITRQDASVLIGRALGLYSDNTANLAKFSDSGQISDYARPYVSALVNSGYINGMSNGGFSPQGRLTRAQAVKIIDNIITEMYNPSKDYTGQTINGSMFIRNKGVTLKNVTVKGNLIVADGVAESGITLDGCTVEGKLVLRGGGGSDNVRLIGTKVGDDVFVSNTTCQTGLSLSGNSNVGAVTARTGVRLDGSGAGSFTIAPDARASEYEISTSLEALDANGPYSALRQKSGTITNARFNEGADNSSMNIAQGSRVSYLSIDAQNVTITGQGSVGTLDVRESGAKSQQQPASVNIGDNLTAEVDGKTVSGRITANTITNINRSSTGMEAKRDPAETGGEDLGLKTAYSSSAKINTVTINQDKTGKIPLSTRNNRAAYWVGIFIPAPASYSSPLESVQYSWDGSTNTFNKHYTSQRDHVTGFTFYVPVTREGDSLKGNVDQQLYIDWGKGNFETIRITGKDLILAELTKAQESVLVKSFHDAVFKCYNGSEYENSEAIRRLLTTDNALGLNLRGYDTYSQADQNYIAVRMNYTKDAFTDKMTVQSRLYIETSGKGALYILNRAMNVPQVRDVLENEEYSRDLGIETRPGSKYYMLSNCGRTYVAKQIMLGRNTDFTSEAAVSKLFYETVDKTRTAETTLLTTINATKVKEEMQKVIENAANADLLDIIVNYNPYKSLSADEKGKVAFAIVDARPFATLDEVHRLFLTMVGEPEDSDDPAKSNTINSVALTPMTATIPIGGDILLVPTIATPVGSFSDPAAVTWSVDKPAVGDIYSRDKSGVKVFDGGKVTGISEGSVKVTITSKKDPKKKATATVKVVKHIPATGLSMDRTYLEIEVGGNRTLSYKLMPSNANSTVSWYSQSEDVATVSSAGNVFGVSPGFSDVRAVVSGVSGDVSGTTVVAVLSDTPGIMMSKTSLRVGIGQQAKLYAAVSPASASRTVYWSTSNKDIVTVDPDGNIKGIALGSATITAESKAHGMKATCTVTVDDRKSIKLSPTALELYIDGEDCIKATMIPDGAPVTELSWTIVQGENPNDHILSYTKHQTYPDDPTSIAYYFKGLRTGSATVRIWLKDDSTIFSEVKVDVLGTKPKLSVKPTAVKVNVGETVLVTPAFSPATIKNKNVSFTMAHAEFATVDADGLVRGVKPGSTFMKVKALATGEEIQVPVTVTTIPIKSVVFPEKYTMNLFDNKDIPLTVLPENATYTVIYDSEAPVYVSVLSDGKLQANKTTIWEEDVLTQIPNPAYDGSNPNIAQFIPALVKKEVDHPVKVRIIVSDGQKTYQGNTLITVLKGSAYGEVDSVKILLSKWVYQVGENQNLSVRFNGGDADKQPANTKVTWTSSNPDVASVNPATGNLIAIKPGMTVITVTSNDGAKTDTKKIVVSGLAITGISYASGLEPDFTYSPNGRWVSMDMSSSGRTKNLGIAVTPNTATDQALTFSVVACNPDGTPSGQAAPVSIDYNGNLTAKNPGLAKITVIPRQTEAYGIAKPGDANVVTQYDNIHSPIFVRGQTTDPNGNTLDPNVEIPLVVENKIMNGTDVFYVWVKPVPVVTASISSDPAPATVYVPRGASPDADSLAALTGVLSPANMQADELEWSVSGASAAFNAAPPSSLASGSTTSSAAVKAVSAGTATVTLRVKTNEALGFLANGTGSQQRQAASEKTATITVTSVARPNPTSLSLSNTTANMTRGSTATLSVPASSISPAYANYNVTWESSDASVVTVAPSGLSATITATNDASKPIGTTAYVYVKVAGVTKATCTVTLSNSFQLMGMARSAAPQAQPASAGAIEPTALALRTEATAVSGETLALTPFLTPYDASRDELVWTSSDETVATVDENGVVTGLKAGKTTITLESSGKKLRSATKVTVVKTRAKPVKSISLSKTSLALLSGKSSKLTVKFSPAAPTLSGVSWISSDEKVARVAPDGNITAVGSGTATVTAVSDDGARTASCSVSVTVPVTGVSLAASLSLKKGETKTLSAVIAPLDASDKSVTWKSSSPKTVSVSANGVVKALKAGKASITVTTKDGKKKAVCSITVK